MKRSSANKRKPKSVPHYTNAQRLVYIERIKQGQKIAAVKDLSFVDFLFLTASGEISIEEANDWLHKSHFHKKTFNAKVDRLAALHSGFEDLPISKLPPPVRPRREVRWKFNRRLPRYVDDPVPLPELPVSHKQAIALINDVIDKDICKYRIIEYACAILRLDIDFISQLLNEMRPGKAPFVSAKRLTSLKREHLFQKFYREGRRYYAISVDDGFVDPIGGDPALFDHNSMNQLLPGFLDHSLEVCFYPRLITNLIHINGRRFVDVYSVGGRPLRIITL